MRRPRFTRCLLAGLVAAAVLSCGLPLLAATPTSAQPASSKTAPPVPLLWKVSDKDNSVYLLGSFHMLHANDYPLSKDVDAALADAESVLFELPPDEMLSTELGAQMAMAAIRTDGTLLDSDLTAAVAHRLKNWSTSNAVGLKGAGMTPEMLQMLEPWFVGLLVTIVEARGQGFDSELGLDAHLAAAAKAQGKPAQGLETGAQQLAMLDGMSRFQQVQMLDDALSEDPKESNELEALHRYWRAGDGDALWREMGTKMRKEYPGLYQRINTERNDAWVPKLEARLKEPGTDDTLVVVGSLHLLGSDGVAEKLKKKGYKVERICSACATK